MYPKEITQQLHSMLPRELLEVIASEKMFDLLDQLQEGYALGHKQRSMLEYELTMRLIGINSLEKLRKRIAQRLELAPEITEKFITKFTENIESQLPEKLLKAQEEYAQTKLEDFNLSHISSKPSNAVALPEILLPQPPEEILIPEHTAADPQVNVVPVFIAPEPKPESTATVPINLPTEETEEEIKITDTRYTGGVDPYREPLE